MTRQQQRYRERRYADRRCAQCATLFTPRSGNTRNCDRCGDLRHRSTLPRPAAPVERPRKPLIGAVAPDFLRLLPELAREFARVDVNRYDVRRRQRYA